MRHFTLLLLLVIGLTRPSYSQQNKLWTEEDRKYLSHHLTRTLDSIISHTKNLSKQQWNFKESPDSWSINQIVEHLGIWELLLQREVSQALAAGCRPELNKEATTDSVVLAFLGEDKQHITTEYTKPFTFTVPTGSNTGENNLDWLKKMRNEGIHFIDSTSTDLRGYFLRQGSANVHQRFIVMFGHIDRHLKQIRRIKLDPRYPKR